LGLRHNVIETGDRKKEPKDRKDDRVFWKEGIHRGSYSCPKTAEVMGKYGG
jgi:hypothetical protein